MLDAGSRFPAVTLPGLDGRMQFLAEAWSGGLALLVLGHSDCRTTRDTLPIVDRIHRRRSSGSVRAILQDDASAARELVAEQSLALPVLLEADPYPLARELGLATVPTLVLVNDAGIVERTSEGFSRGDLEGFGRSLGVAEALFAPEHDVPSFRPG